MRACEPRESLRAGLAMSLRPPSNSREEAIAKHLDEVAESLPAQGPLGVFIHHNPLHAFEGQHFEEAALEQGRLLGCEAFLPEATYRGALADGRITPAAVARVLDEACATRLGLFSAAGVTAGLSPTRQVLEAELAYGEDPPGRAELRWLLGETAALTRLDPAVPRAARVRLLGAAVDVARELEPRVVTDLWHACCELGARSEESDARRGSRHRSTTTAVSFYGRGLRPARAGRPLDTIVAPFIIRLAGAYLDQGIARWPAPLRERGFLRAVLELYGRGGPAPAHGLESLPSLFAEELRSGRTELASIAHSLDELGLGAEREHAYLAATCLATKGWAGLFRQMEKTPERAPVEAPPATLAAFVAVRLLVERAAQRSAKPSPERAAPPLSTDSRHARGTGHLDAPEPAWPLFRLAQAMGWTPAELRSRSADEALELCDVVLTLDGTERRRLLHRAYELSFRDMLFGALSAPLPTRSAPSEASPAARPPAQLVFCLDEREESFRRHLEDALPELETLGAAGFFSVPMAYRALGHVRAVPLCPIGIRPRHEVAEVAPPASAFTEGRELTRRAMRTTVASVARGSHTLVIGSFVAVLFGALLAIPLVLQVVAPRLSRFLSRRSRALVAPERHARLAVRADAGSALPVPASARPARDLPARQLGFTTREMADCVERLLVDMGVATRLAPLVFFIGHGSTTPNNPLASAYHCGACGGGRGGPNGRAAASMGNDPEVRELLAKRGLVIPADTWFIGGEHDTANDALTLFDEDLVPASHRDTLERVLDALDEARARNAQERCRRFGVAAARVLRPLALAHVEARAVDLAEARPEYCHGGNAACFIGRRARTRHLYLDRRVFLVSYDPTSDADGVVLRRLLAAVVPVVVGINLEYFFGAVDPSGYGCGTKLPHNVTGLIGVMDGAASDLRTGLPIQTLEIHEPMRLALTVECEREPLLAAIAADASLRRLVENEWLFLSRLCPKSQLVEELRHGAFAPFVPGPAPTAHARTSRAWYRAHAGNVPFATLGESP